MTLPIRVGVNRGHIFAGEIGPSYRRTYTVMGDTVNLAARLMAKAAPGQIITTDDVLSRSRTSFETDALPPFMVKGKAKPIDAFSLGREIARRQLRDESTLPLVGRDDELARLHDAVAAVTAGQGASVELVADAGIGKTRLVEELRALDGLVRARHRDLRGRTRAAAPTRVGRAAAQPVRTRARRVRRSRREADPGDDRRGRAPSSRRAPAARDGLRHRSRRHPRDGHTRTPVPARAHRLRGRRAPRRCVPGPRPHRRRGRALDGRGVRGARRPPGDARRRAAVARVRDPAAGLRQPSPCPTAPSRSRSNRSRATTRSRSSPPPPRTRRCARTRSTRSSQRAAGNPLFLGELILLTRSGADADVTPRVRRGAPHRRDRQPPASAPPPAAVRRGARPQLRRPRCSTTSSASRSTTPASSRSSPATSSPRAPAASASATRSVRDAAYEGLSYKRRRELHTRAGEAIERRSGDRTDDHAELLSLHFFEAARYDAAWRYACIGAEHANEAYANVEAAALYHRALASGRAGRRDARPSSRSIFESLGDVQERIGVYHDAVAAVPRRAQAAARRPAGAGPNDRQGSARRRTPGPLLELGPLDPQGPAPARRPARCSRVQRPRPARRDVRRDPPGPGSTASH